MRIVIIAGVAAATFALAGTAVAASSPTITPGTVTAISDTTSVLNGTVNPNGQATTYQFDWGLTPALGNVSPAVPASAGAGTAPIAEHAKIGGLSPDTTYYYELRASNGSGASSSAPVTFKTTGNPAPTSTTDAAADVARYSANLVGTVNPDNQATTYYFQYGLSPNYTFQTNVQTLAAGVDPVTVMAALPGIEPGTVFHYRLVASHGATSTTAGNDMTFQTAPFPRPTTKFSLSVSAAGRKTFRATGRISLPATTPAAFGCQGLMRVRYYDAGRLLTTRYVPVGLNCVYSEYAHIGSAPAGAQLAVRAHYQGDLYNGPSGIKSATVMAR